MFTLSSRLVDIQSDDMAQKLTGEKKTMSSREKDILNENVPATGTSKGDHSEGKFPIYLI